MSKCALCKTSLKDDEINVCDKCRLDFLNFKRQLAEKDKEINELRFEKRNIFGLIEKMEVKVAGVTKEKVQETRKQVCDEIRKAIDNEEYELWGENSRILSISADKFNTILDQIEKENNNDNHI